MTTETLAQLIDLADGHQTADEYKPGRYDWKNGGACSIGCTILDAIKLGLLPKTADPDDHAAMAMASGVPEVAWRLCDHIFEGIEPSKRSGWTPRFLRAIRVGREAESDFSNLPARLVALMMRKLADDAIREDVKASALKNAELYIRRAKGGEPTDQEWDAAWQQAYAARQQAYAAWQQAYAARQQAYAAWQQADAAWQQFWAWAADVLCEELAKGPTT